MTEFTRALTIERMLTEELERLSRQLVQERRLSLRYEQLADEHYILLRERVYLRRWFRNYGYV